MVAAGHEHRSAGNDTDSALARRLSIPWIILASILCGVGLFLVSYWLTFFYWPAFAGVGLVIIGAILLFNRRTGIDRA